MKKYKIILFFINPISFNLYIIDNENDIHEKGFNDLKMNILKYL